MNDINVHPQLQRLKRAGLYVLVAAIALAAWGIYARVHARAALVYEAEEASIPIVDVVTPIKSNRTDELVLPGNVQAFIDAPIYARTNGYLARWYADIGKHVKAGDLLAVIQTPEVDAQLRQAQADYDTATANNHLSQITAARYQKLRKTGLVAQQDVDNAQGDADAKKAELESARQNLGRLQQMEAFNRITAPFDGVITARRIDVGALVTEGSTTGQELFHLTSTRRLRIYIEVPEAYSSLIQPGLAAQLSLVEHPDQLFPAKVISTARSIDAHTRTLLTELEADNEKGEMLPGAYAQVHVRLPPGLASWRLPSDALLFRADGLHVAAVDAHSHVQLKAIHVGRDFGTQVEILSGVEAGDRIVVSPPDSIMNGELVKVRGSSPTGQDPTGQDSPQNQESE